MKKRIITYIIILFLLPLLGISIIFAFDNDTKMNISYIYAFYLILFFVFFIYMVLFEYKNFINKIGNIIISIILIIFNIILIVFSFYKFYNVLYALLAITCVNLLPFVITKYKLLYFLLTLGIYPIMFYAFEYTEYSLSGYLAYVLLTIGYSLWKKYHKTRIYLNDNY